MPPASPDPLLNFFVVLSEPLTPVVSGTLTTGDGSEGSNMTPDRLICFNHTAAIRRMLPRCSDAMLSALRMRLIHAEQLRRLGVERHGEVGSKAVVKGD